MNILQLDQVSKSYGRKAVLECVTVGFPSMLRGLFCCCFGTDTYRHELSNLLPCPTMNGERASSLASFS